MKVVELSDIRRKHAPLYYRREFQANATVEILAKPRTFPIDFVLEHTATGAIEVSLNIAEAIEYPLVPVANALKSYILDLDKAGSLP